MNAQKVLKAAKLLFFFISFLKRFRDFVDSHMAPYHIRFNFLIMIIIIISTIFLLRIWVYIDFRVS